MDVHDTLAQHETIKSLLDRLGKAWPVPDHVVSRLAVLATGEPVVYVSRRVEAPDPRQVDGEVAVFTTNRVIYATFEKSPTSRSSFQERGATATVRVRCWSRRSLRELSLTPDGHRWRNLDSEWSEVRTAGEVPSLSATLHFGDESLTLPLDGSSNEKRAAARLLDLVPSLLDDLERTP